MFFLILPCLHTSTDQALQKASCVASWRTACKAVEDHISAVVFWICHVSFIVDHCDQNYCPCLGSHGILFDDQVEDLMYYCCCCFFVSSFDIFCFDSIVVCLFPCFLWDCRLQSSVLFWRIMGCACLCSSSSRSQLFSGPASLSRLSFLSSFLFEKRYLWNTANMLAMPFLVASMFPNATDLIPLNYSEHQVFLMSLGSFVVPDSLFDLLIDVSHLGFVFSVRMFCLSV